MFKNDVWMWLCRPPPLAPQLRFLPTKPWLCFLPHNASLQGSGGSLSGTASIGKSCVPFDILSFFPMNTLKVNFYRSIFIFTLLLKSTPTPPTYFSTPPFSKPFLLSLIQSLSPNLLFLYTHIVQLAVCQFWHALIHLICQLYEITSPAVPF